MSPARLDEVAQKEVVSDLRDLIDNAIRHKEGAEPALSFARRYSSILSTPYAAHNLGNRRWAWLNEQGFYAIGEPVEIEGVNAIKATIRPEVRK